jgi:hypothetical protein
LRGLGTAVMEVVEARIRDVSDVSARPHRFSSLSSANNKVRLTVSRISLRDLQNLIWNFPYLGSYLGSIFSSKKLKLRKHWLTIVIFILMCGKKKYFALKSRS